jgi:DNA-binding LacI/PurR family transcriptional regulator
MTSAGLSPTEENIFITPDVWNDPRVPDEVKFYGDPDQRFLSQKAYGYGAGLNFNPGRHTAVVCVNDNVAVGLIRCLRDRGLRVPEDVSVTGYDNNPADESVQRELTTFTHPEEQMADAIISIAERRLLGEAGLGDRMQVILQPILVSRTSWKTLKSTE